MRVAILLFAGTIALLHSLGVVVLHDHPIALGDGRAHVHSVIPDDHGHVGHIVRHVGSDIGADRSGDGQQQSPAPPVETAHADTGDAPRQRALTALAGLLLVTVALATIGGRTTAPCHDLPVRRAVRARWPRQRERLALLTVLLV